MTETITAPDYRALADDDLAVMLSKSETTAFDAIIAEMTRRDRCDRLARGRAALATLRAEAQLHVEADYRAASEACRGVLLNEQGKRALADDHALWTVPERDALRWASEELREHWQFTAPRITAGRYVREQLREARRARAEAREAARAERHAEPRTTTGEAITEGGSRDDRTDDYETAGTGLAGDEAGALRREPAPAQAPQGSGRGQLVDRGRPAPVAAEDSTEGTAAAGRAGGIVRDGGAMTITETAPAEDTAQWDSARAEARARMAAATGQLRAARTATVPVTAAVAAQRGCKHWNSKYGTPAECGDCPARRGGGGQVAVPSGTVATRPEAIDGARLLNLADAWMGRHVWMSDAARHTAILYTAAQHFRLTESGRLAWPRFGRMLYVAEQPGSGKTTAMVLMGYMSAPWFRGIDANPTAPGLCASISEERAAVFIDELHRLLGAKGTRKADVVTILNAGYEKNGTYLNARGGKANRTPVYAPAVMAGKDVLLTAAAEEIGDLLDRCAAIVHMTRPPGDAEMAEITDDTETQGAAIAARLAGWAAGQMAGGERFREAFTSACDRAREIGLTGRAKDVWAPLIATGLLASEGHADAACEAALEFRAGQPAQAEEDPLAGLEAELSDGGNLPAWG